MTYHNKEIEYQEQTILVRDVEVVHVSAKGELLRLVSLAALFADDPQFQNRLNRDETEYTYADLSQLFSEGVVSISATSTRATCENCVTPYTVEPLPKPITITFRG